MLILQCWTTHVLLVGCLQHDVRLGFHMHVPLWTT
jgi:hypothetical protein